jgi:hypothetical protein
MCSIDIQALPKRERNRIVVQSSVGRRVVHRDRRKRQTRDHLLDPADSLYASDRRTEGGAIPELEIKPR